MPQHLPQFQNNDTTLQLMQSKWAGILNPILDDPTNSGLLLTNVALSVGDNVIYHKLGRQLQGWVITDQNANSNIYRSQPLNSTNLTLNASAKVTISLWVF